ncbi:MAG TPA: hypothetical protein VE422_37755 [Terriglobia bacterium]|nr:hypothetical protein [Terriglobia bacterium]
MRFISIFTHEPLTAPDGGRNGNNGQAYQRGHEGGWLIATEGVHFGAAGVRVHKSAGGKITVIGGYAVLKSRSQHAGYGVPKRGELDGLNSRLTSRSMLLNVGLSSCDLFSMS